jgi:hypothetical protein
MGRVKGMIIRLKREPDPVLEIDELEFISGVLTGEIKRYEDLMSQGRVSESVIRARLTAIDCDNKVRQVLRSYGRRGPSYFDKEL